jgi:hypothetical protein
LHSIHLSLERRSAAMYRVPKPVRIRHGQDGAVVLDKRHGQMFNLTVVGLRIVQLLTDGRSEENVIREISRECDVSQDVVAQDVREFLRTLEKYQLVEEYETSAVI